MPPARGPRLQLAAVSFSSLSDAWRSCRPLENQGEGIAHRTDLFSRNRKLRSSHAPVTSSRLLPGRSRQPCRAGTAVDNRFQFGLFFGRNGKLIQRLLKIVKEGLRLARGTFQIGIPARRLALCEYSAGRHVIPKLGCPCLFASDAPAS